MVFLRLIPGIRGDNCLRECWYAIFPGEMRAIPD